MTADQELPRARGSGARARITRLRRAGLALMMLAATVGLSGSLAMPAQAQARLILIGSGKASCPAGYLCAWESDWYAGRGVAIYGDESYWANFPSAYVFIQNNADSFYNHGNTSDVRLGRYGYLDGGTFVLCRGDSISYTPSARSDGAIPGLKWWNEVSSNDWFNSIWC